MSVFKQATKRRRKLRLGIVGPSGSGKTWTSLVLATRIIEMTGGGTIGLLDTEHGSAEDYANDFDFRHARMGPPYSPERYARAFKAVEAEEHAVLIVDSLSHGWDGEGGVLEMVDQASTNKFSGWRVGTPAQNRLINSLLATPAHVIATMRAKEEYVVDASGKPQKVGTEPVQRKGVAYEFAIVFDIDLQHTITVSKSRAGRRLPVGSVIRHPAAGPEVSFDEALDEARAVDYALADELLGWVTEGAEEEKPPAPPPPPPTPTGPETPDPVTQPAATPAATPAAAAAPAATPAADGDPYALPEDATIAQRDAVIVARLARGDRPGAVAADLHVSSSIVRNARKKAEDAAAAAGSPETASPASDAPVQPETPATPPEAGSSPEAPASGGENGTGELPSVSWAEGTVARFEATFERLEGLANPTGGWREMINRRAGELFSKPFVELSDEQAAILCEKMEEAALALEQRARERAEAAGAAT